MFSRALDFMVDMGRDFGGFGVPWIYRPAESFLYLYTVMCEVKKRPKKG